MPVVHVAYVILDSQPSSTTSTATAPTLQPDLIKDMQPSRTGDGQYLVSYLLPARLSNTDQEQITSFVFRIEGNDTTYIHLVRYFHFCIVMSIENYCTDVQMKLFDFQAGLDDVLDLSSLSCQRVNVTFAVVTSELNPSQPLAFSPVLSQFCIDGGK